MEGYGQFCPVAKAAEVICRPWTALLLREILLGSRRFNEIRRGVPQMSPALLSQRLRELQRAGVIERGDDGRYLPTPAGEELLPVIQALGVWGQRWARSSYSEEELDPGLLLWDMHRYLPPDGLGPQRHVVGFEFPDQPPARRHYWMVAAPEMLDVCLVDPGFPVDAVVEADLRALTEVWMGDRDVNDHLRSGRIKIRGPRPLVRRIPEWLGRHPILGDVQPARPVESVA